MIYCVAFKPQPCHSPRLFILYNSDDSHNEISSTPAYFLSDDDSDPDGHANHHAADILVYIQSRYRSNVDRRSALVILSGF